ncbi:polysaccharide deacetylase [Roseomonas sp. M0104]|uniref:Polysaccharide deacetylase n=1 Tax=Teichococcus coralli TaxID=2545983 RepID=A0A845BK95_9PROT|nr:polysaccharide deacetylase [Pseudoroseomonas coralli]MXP65582.1 polysaccharide deacetylase [Pseudoroseomonas coralli]
MNTLPAQAPEQAFVPLALEVDDIAVYASIGAALDCGTEACAEAFMLATPAARDTAVRLWQAMQRLNASRPSAPGLRAQWQLQARQALEAMRALLGLDPERMPTAALAAAGLRYSA